MSSLLLITNTCVYWIVRSTWALKLALPLNAGTLSQFDSLKTKHKTPSKENTEADMDNDFEEGPVEI